MILIKLFAQGERQQAADVCVIELCLFGQGMARAQVFSDWENPMARPCPSLSVTVRGRVQLMVYP